MKKVLLAVALGTVMASAPVLANDQTIMFEFGFGFGNASGGRTDGNDNAKWCKNRNTGRMTFGAIRYSYDDVEVHVARWFHDEEVANCDRDMWAVGAGYVIDTVDTADMTKATELYASWTPGFAYVWGDNADFTGKDNDSTNWRQTSNWQTFNRVAIGFGDEDIAGEVAVHRYGTFNPEHGEYFGTVGLQLRDLDEADNAGNTDGDKELTPPGGDTIINEGDTTIINIIDNTETGPNGGEETNQVDGAGGVDLDV